MGRRQENGDEEHISHDRMEEWARWAEWPNSAPISYELMKDPRDGRKESDCQSL